MSTSFVRRSCGLLVLSVAGLTSACDSSTPLALADEPVVLMGRVANLAAPSASGPATTSGSSALEGIEVSIEGSAVTTITDVSGNFRLEVEAGEGTIVLRFRRGSLDARLEIQGVAPGTLIRFEVGLSGDGGTLISRDDGDGAEVEGRATLVALLGDAPARTLRVELAGDGSSTEVDILEGATRFEADGDIVTFAGLLDALHRADLTVRIEGHVEIQDDFGMLAVSVKVETDEHVDGAHDDDSARLVEFEGIAALLSVSGTAPTRTAHLSVTGNLGVWLVDLVEGHTQVDAGGDFRSVGDVVTALASTGLVMRIEGEGTADGLGMLIVAATARAEVD